MDLKAGHASILVFVSLLVLQVKSQVTVLTREEDFEIEQQLKRLNKPAVKTIQTKHGDVYACVDFYKQPAFDHPLLKNHSYHFQMKPNSTPKTKRVRIDKNSTDHEVISIEPQRLDCPFGTVPIRRITKDDLIRAKLHQSKVFSSNYGYKPSTAEKPGLHIVVLRANDGSKKYNGGCMRLSVEKPYTEASQYSQARMEVGNGPDAIQVGSMVNPDLYGDDRTRGFISTRTSQSSCFNNLCPGFISVTQHIPVDEILEPITDPSKGKYYIYESRIYRDNISGNWWLELGPEHLQVGFWPQKIFSGLKDLATNVEWGGEAMSPPEKKSPKMGRGHYLHFKIWTDAFIDHMTIINEDGYDVDVDDTVEFADVNFKYYGVHDHGYRESGHRRMLYYGGLGGLTGN